MRELGGLGMEVGGGGGGGQGWVRGGDSRVVSFQCSQMHFSFHHVL